jgi:hypothetical protein
MKPPPRCGSLDPRKALFSPQENKRMAVRPVFTPEWRAKPLANETQVNFVWHAGLSVAQKQKSIRSLHAAAADVLGVPISKILEISSKSEQDVGRRLSAFVLELDLPNGVRSTVECAFQGSKRFCDGGPYTDLYGLDSRSAKRDPRLKSSGPLQAFSFFGDEWPLEPKTGFYDWLYISCVSRDSELMAEIIQFEAFTDIEFNPAKSLNCQAHTAARLAAITKRRLLGSISEKDTFLSLY